MTELLGKIADYKNKLKQDELKEGQVNHLIHEREQENVWLLEQLSRHFNQLDFPDLFDQRKAFLGQLDRFNPNSIAIRPIRWHSPSRVISHLEQARAIYGYVVLTGHDVNGPTEDYSEAFYALGIASEAKDQAMEFQRMFAPGDGGLYAKLTQNWYTVAIGSAYNHNEPQSARKIPYERIAELDQELFLEDKPLRAYEVNSLIFGNPQQPDDQTRAHNQIAPLIDMPVLKLEDQRALERAFDSHLTKSRVINNWLATD